MIPARYEHTEYEDVPAGLKKLLEGMKRSRRGIYLWGGVGTGKTHIAYSMKRKWDETALRSAQFWNATELIHEIKADFDRDNINKVRPEQRITESEGLIFIDDIGAEKSSDFVSETLYAIINNRYERMLPVVYTSNLSLKELAERIGDRAVSRIVESCDIVELSGEDRRLQKVKKLKV